MCTVHTFTQTAKLTFDAPMIDPDFLVSSKIDVWKFVTDVKEFQHRGQKASLKIYYFPFTDERAEKTRAL